MQYNKEIRQVIRLNYDQSGNIRSETSYGPDQYPGVLSSGRETLLVQKQIC